MNDNSVRLVFDSESDGELPRHLWPTSGLGWLRKSAQPHRRPCVRVRSSFASVSRRTQIFTNREWGGRWLYGHHVLNGPPHRALHVLALVNNGARINRWPFGQPSTSDLLQSQGEI